MEWYWGAETIDGFYVSFYGIDNDVLKYEIDGKMHKSTMQFCEWAKHLSGNAPCGTEYGWFRISLPNGKRLTRQLYI